MTPSAEAINEFQSFLKDVADASVVLQVQTERIQKLERDLIAADGMLEAAEKQLGAVWEGLRSRPMLAEDIRVYLEHRKAHP